MMESDLKIIVDKAAQEIANAKRIPDLEQLRSRLLGKKSALNEYLKKLAQLPQEEKRKQGQAIHQAKQQIERFIKAGFERLNAEDIAKQLRSEVIDVSLPGRGQSIGNLHPVTKTRERIEAFFTSVGFTIAKGPEIEDDYYNFEALNIPVNHPARALHDTFYLTDTLLLRTHTSPAQIRAMQEKKIPLKMISSGRVFRCDSDVTHTPMFHQTEGLVIDKSSNFSELKGLLTEFLQKFFEENNLITRFRAAYFPFTEPSAEVDIQCVMCSGKGCRICSHAGWLEVLGCGMVHPKVLEKAGLSSELYQGYAFGLGVDRLAMLRYRIPDLRQMFENDLRFLDQF